MCSERKNPYVELFNETVSYMVPRALKELTIYVRINIVVIVDPRLAQNLLD